LLLQVFANLVGNAPKLACQVEKVALRLSTRKESEHSPFRQVRLEISDTGIDPEDQEAI